ncbi:MAG: outer membrane lipoprotein carrier protein LolA [Fibrobacter sp.]|jgi:hypothetical protein|nr:outer membrane lipoprotein carrier protein LolA [Fibrobacter sp.]
MLKVFLPLLFTLAGILSAQEPSEEFTVFRMPLNEEDKPLFEEVCLQLAKYPIVKGNFKQKKVITKLSRTFESEGVFLISEQDGILWDTQKPFPLLLAVTDSKVVQKTPQGKYQVIHTADNAVFREFAKTIQAVFSGKPAELYGRFDIYFFSQPPHKKGVLPGSHIGLIPKDKTLRDLFAFIYIRVDSVLADCILKESNGDQIVYQFSGHQFPERLTKEEQEAFLAE